MNPDTKKFTWNRFHSDKPAASRIDMIFLPIAWSNKILESSISPCRKTDHSIVTTVINIEEVKRGPGTWKFNNKLLLNPQFVVEMQNLIDKQYTYSEILDPSALWLQIKKSAIDYSKQFGRSISKIKNKRKIALNKLHDILIKEFNNGNKDDVLIKEINRINTELEDIEDEEIKSIIFRSKAKWVREGERNSKYFFALEKKKYLSKSMSSLLKESGELITNQAQILDEQAKFYKKLYTTNPEIQFNLPFNENDPTISDDDRLLTELPITEAELYDACMTLKSDKTPGIDGLTIEFYRKFWKNISPALIRMYYDAYQKDILPLSTRRGIISLLPKKNKDTRIVKNLRPLTLLNNDYKILAKTIDNRISPLLHKIINKDQTGFIKGRCISHNIRKSLDVMEFCQKNKIPALIMSCDMDKCFDRIEHKSLYTVLSRFGFGDGFIKWVRLFYSNLQICTQNYGNLSDWFDKTRGVNQGCPLSPSAYICIGEAMANSIRNHNNVKGITIGKVEYLLSQFADDTDLYLPFDQNVVNAVLDIISDVEKSTGLKVSYEKTTVYRIGSIMNSSAIFYTTRAVKWTNNPVNTLGMDLRNFNDLDKNFDSVMNKLEVVSKMWYYRSLTLIGKIIIVNTLMSSLFVYRLQNIANVTADLYDRYERVINSFIWSNNKAKIPLSTLYLSHENGGLKLSNLKIKHDSLLCKWVYVCCTDVSIANLANDNIKTFENKIWEHNLNAKDFEKITSKGSTNFWSLVGHAWTRLHYHRPDTVDDILNQHIAWNSHIRVGNLPLTPRKHWPERIKDISLNNVILSPTELQNRYPQLTWLDCLTITTAIPQTWKENATVW